MDLKRAGLAAVVLGVVAAATSWHSAAGPVMTQAQSAPSVSVDMKTKYDSGWTPKQMFMIREVVDFQIFLAGEVSSSECSAKLSAVASAPALNKKEILEARNCVCGGGGAFGDAPNDVINDLIAAGASHEWSETAFNRWRERLKNFASKTGRPGLERIVNGRTWPTVQHGPVEWVRSVLGESWNELEEFFSQ